MTDRALLMAKARAIADSIDKLGEAQQAAYPTCDFGADYNRMLDLIKKEHPLLEPFLPPPVYVELEDRITYASFAQIATYCEQVYQLLSTDSGEGL